MKVEDLLKRMTREELEAVLGKLPFCFWDGLPPCPKCGGDHGDFSATLEKDADYRGQLSEHDPDRCPTTGQLNCEICMGTCLVCGPDRTTCDHDTAERHHGWKPQRS